MPARPSAGSALPSARFWAPVAVIGTAQFLVIMNNAIINIALPSLVSDLGIGPADQSWVVTVYLLAFGALLLLGGRVGDAVGHRRAFVAGLALTAVAAVGAGLADTGWAYLAWRATQGAAAAFVSPAAVALLSNAFADPAQRARAFGIYGAVTGAGGGAGLLLGGLLTDALSWRWAMLVSAPIAIIAIIGALTALPRSHATTAGPMRQVSVLLIILAVGSLLVAITRAGEREHPLVALTALASAAACAWGFRVAERRTKHPLIPRGFFASRARRLGLITVGTGALGLTGLFVVLSQQMQEASGMSPMEAGLATLPYPVGMVLSTQFAPRLIDRFGAQRVAIAGLLASAVGIVPLAWAAGAPYAALTLPSLLFLSTTIGPAFVSGTQLAMGGVREDKAGVAGALLNSASEIGGAVGVATISASGVAIAMLRGSGDPAYGAAMCAAVTLLLLGALGGWAVYRGRESASAA